MEELNLTQGEKMIGAMSYLMFFLPLINRNRKEFNRFHANQGLELFLLIVVFNVLNVLLSFFPVVGDLFAAVFLGIILYLFTIGILSAAKGEMRVFPLIGRFRIIRKKEERPNQ